MAVANENGIIGIRKGAAASAPLESGHYEQAICSAFVRLLGSFCCDVSRLHDRHS